MSFDAEFDYTNMVNQEVSHINMFQQMVDSTNVEIANMNNVVGFDAIKAAKLPQLEKQLEIYQKQTTNCNMCMDNIESIEATSQENKEILYKFFQVQTRNKERYMCTIVCNYVEMVVDADILALINDTTNSLEVKKIIGDAIISKYKSLDSLRTM